VIQDMGPSPAKVTLLENMLLVLNLGDSWDNDSFQKNSNFKF
jgi:hypothetical protein